MKTEHRNVLISAIEHYGSSSQITKAMEELSELLVHLAKFSHAPERYADKAPIIDEIADVAIMVEQLAMIFGQDKVSQQIDYKIQRLFDRIV